jgi:hypothetical protein
VESRKTKRIRKEEEKQNAMSAWNNQKKKTFSE